MSLRSPWMLSALVAIPALVAAYAAARRRRSQRTARLVVEGLVTRSPGGRTRRRRDVTFAVFVTALVVLVVGLARPVATVRTPRREGTVVLAVDVSNSMGATDVKPSRFAAAKAAADAFVQRQAPAVRVGVVAFGNGAVVVQTPTIAHSDAVRAIDRLSVGGGTSVGQGLLTSLDAIAGKQLRVNESALGQDEGSLDIGYYGSSSIVVFSDGENVTGPDPATMARVASVAGVRVHTIGVGTAQGTVVQVDGFSVATALDEATLKQISSVTNGSYHSAGDAAGLAAVARSIDLRYKIVSQHTEVTALFALAGVALLLVAASLSVWQSGRVV